MGEKDIRASNGPLVAVAAGGPPLGELARLAEELPAGEWRARSDAAQVLASYLSCHPRVAVVRYPGLTADAAYREASSRLRCGFGPWVDVLLADCAQWWRIDVGDGDAVAWVTRLEELLAKR